MKRGTISASLGALALTAVTFAAATPASAGSITTECGASNAGTVLGYTQHERQGTTLTSLNGWCGQLGLRVQYTHVGGTSWTSWKYDKGGENVTADVGTPLRSRHTTQVGDLDFYTENG